MRIVLVYMTDRSSQTADDPCQSKSRPAFLAAVPDGVEWVVRSDQDDAATSLAPSYCDSAGALFWRAIPRSAERGLPDITDAAQAFTIAQLATSGSNPLDAADVRRKICVPLAQRGADAIVVSLRASSSITKTFLEAGFRILGTESRGRVLPRVPLASVVDGPLPPAIVLGRPNPNMLAQLRALGRSGIPVYCIIVRGEPAFIAKVSRYATGVFDLRRGGDRDVVRAIRGIAQASASRPVLFYGGDLDITLASRILGSIADCVTLVSDPHRAEVLNAKTEQCARVEAAGIRVPRGGGIRSSQDLEHLCAALTFPVICRPVEIASRGGFADKIIIAQTAEEMRSRLHGLAAEGKSWVLAQEFIPGPDDSLLFALGTCNAAGKVTSIVTGRKLCQYPAGLMCRGETFEDAELRGLATTAFEALGVEGVLGVEFKRHALSGELYYIEVNFRPENIIAVTEASGVNVLLIGYLQAAGLGTLVVPMRMRPALWRDLSMELLGWLSRRFPWSKGLRTNVRRRHVGALWASDDPWPALAWHLSKVTRLVLKMTAVLKSAVGAESGIRSGRAVR